MRTLRFALAACFAVSLFACSSDNGSSPPSPDASVDGRAADAAVGDAGSDATGDATDASSDATTEPSIDAGSEASSGGSSDAASEASAADEEAGAVLTDSMIVGILMAANLGEIQEAYLAVGAPDGGDAGFDAGAARSTNADVVAFANMMIADHTASQATLVSFGIPATTSPLQQQLVATTQSDVTRLGLLSGAAFDRAYLQAQIAAHTTVGNLIENELEPAVQNAPLQMYLPMLLTTVDAHLQHAQSLLGDAGAPGDAAAGDAGAAGDTGVDDAGALDGGASGDATPE